MPSKSRVWAAEFSCFQITVKPFVGFSGEGRMETDKFKKGKDYTLQYYALVNV